MRFKKRERVSTDIDPDKDYSNTELGEIADQILRDDARTETCRTCDLRGEVTGRAATQTQEIDNKEVSIDFPELICPNGHRWFKGEGKERGIGGDNPILFEEHIYQRKRREIVNALGVPDPEIVSGLYFRSHPNGRKVNSKENRKKSGSSFYK